MLAGENTTILMQYPEFHPGSVPVEVAAAAYGMSPALLKHKMEFGEIKIGVMELSDRKRGVRKYRNFYISPKKLWEETGYLWKGEKRISKTVNEPFPD